jgi:regulator of sigma E protease
MIFDAGVDVLLLLVILVALVVIHELGHFLVAKRSGVRVHEFGIGFPPRAAVLHRGSETVYTLNWLPIGGFVRLEGENGESADPRAFVNQRLGTRLAILAAGVTMNFLLAWLIFGLIAGVADPLVNVRVAYVQPGSPAAEVGLQGGVQIGTRPDGSPIYDASGDLIVAIDAHRFPLFERPDTGGDAPLQYLRAKAQNDEPADRRVTLTVRRADGSLRDIPVTLRPEELAKTSGALGIGVQGFELSDLQRGPLDAAGVGLTRTIDSSTLILRGLGQLVQNLDDPPVQGPVGMVSTVGTIRNAFPPAFLAWLIGVLSANLAIVNALPFPPLDGGRIAMALVQRLTGNRLSPSTERAVYLAGFMLLMGLLVWVTYFDIRRLGGG